MAAMMDPAKKATQKLWSKDDDFNKIYVTKPRAIYFWFLHKEVTGRNYNIVKKVSDIIKDNPEVMDSTKNTALAKYIKNNNT